ncbi:hypothetical protein Lpp126_09009 [Lacticaseibacillus paracasei subsp. paracasei Lpp126]|uniref:Uncharacterized protein n=1 Tax=Lacticaseibacillus paracasei subsp. paracasei Lpp126 TaxID=1256206 RepID=S2RDK5_LACPA|nr:hypothetical protein Lpp126_09009 [Lacticaseibacillus paracasei subsp. paracasei Lpp126]
MNLTAVNASVTCGYSTDPDVRQFIMLNSPFVTVTKMKKSIAQKHVLPLEIPLHCHAERVGNALVANYAILKPPS